MTETAPHVLTAISGVMADLSAEGISKHRKNTQQGYSFRGIDDVYNALAPILAKHKLVITPRVLTRECVERQSKNGGALFYVTVDMEFDLASAVDGSKIVSRTFGEAQDSADKATNKAMSAAFKYMAMQQFCIPTEGDNDADAHTHEVAPRGFQPSGSARTAVNTLETYQRDRDGFKAFWNLNKDGLKRTLDAEDYAWVVTNMKRIAESMSVPAPLVLATPNEAEQRRVANGHERTAALLDGDEIPF